MEGRSVSENPLALPRPDRDPLESLGINTNKSWQQISIMEPGTVRTLGRDQFIMFTENRPGEHIHAYRQPYWLMPEFKGKYGADPYHV